MKVPVKKSLDNNGDLLFLIPFADNSAVLFVTLQRFFPLYLNCRKLILVLDTTQNTNLVRCDMHP